MTHYAERLPFGERRKEKKKKNSRKMSESNIKRAFEEEGYCSHPGAEQ